MLDEILLRIAKTAILQKFDTSKVIDTRVLVENYPFLQEQRATFVTLNKNHQLRGCIGSIIAHRPLLDDVIHNAQAAAFEDPRFAKLSVEELSSLNVEVSVLTPPQILEYGDINDLLAKVRPHQDGLILKHGFYQGTFLPQVWEQLPTPELFLEHLSYKAGAQPSIYKEHPTIYRYTVEAIEESFDAILSL